MSSKYGVIILSGGKSKRMNFPKVFLNMNGKTFLEKITAEYAKTVSEMVVVIQSGLLESKWQKYLINIDMSCRVIPNYHYEVGKFHSIKLGATYISADYCFIQNIDNPFISSYLLDIILKNKNQTGITIPTFEGKGGHPVLISRNVIEDILSNKKEDMHIKDFYSRYSKKFVEVPNSSILANINTPKDYHNHILSVS